MLKAAHARAAAAGANLRGRGERAGGPVASRALGGAASEAEVEVVAVERLER